MKLFIINHHQAKINLRKEIFKSDIRFKKEAF